MPNKHHHIPCAYLWNFSSNPADRRKAIIYAYDKVTNKCLDGNVESFAYIKGQYEAHNLPDPEYYEKLYARKEGEMSSLLTDLLADIRGHDHYHTINKKCKRELATHFCIQLARVKKSITQLKTAFDDTARNEILHRIRQEKNPQNRTKMRLELKRLKDDNYHDISLSLATDEKTFHHHIDSLCDKVWTYYVNTTSIPFVTSDVASVVVKLSEGATFDSPDIVAYYPLSHDICVYIIDKVQCEKQGKDYTLIDNMTLEVPTPTFVSNANAVQFHRCTRQIYANVDVKPHFYTLSE